MQISQRGLDFIKQWEGFRDRPYDDGYGNLTIGYGHLIRSNEHFGQISHSQAEQILALDVAGAVGQVNSLVRVPLSQAQFDALVSLAFNWGGFPKSQLLQYLNAGDYAAAAQRLGEHPVTSGGRYSQGLQHRRTAEKQFFLSGGTYAVPAPDDLPESSYPDIAFDDDSILPSGDSPAPPDDNQSSMTPVLLIGAAAIVAVVLLTD